jgi:hypothetical protein
MGMDMHRQARALARAPHQVVDRKAGELIAAFGEKEPRQLRVAALFEVALEHPKLLGQQGFP